MRVGSIFGIDIYVNISWLFVFALVAWSLANNGGPLHIVVIAPAARALLVITTALFFFLSILLHELAHSLVARKRGIAVRGITLFIFGGVSMIEGEADTAPGEAWISLVGPLVSLVLGVAFVYGSALLAVGEKIAIPIHSAKLALALACGYLGYANLLLAAFNLLPAYPLDGGRLFHAFIWRITKNRERATNMSVYVGRAIASLLIGYGVFDTIMSGPGGGLWLTFIGWYVLQAGEAERKSVRVQNALRGHTALDLAGPPKLRIAADQTAEAALEQLLQQQVHAAPVYIGERFLGIVKLQELVRVPEPSLTYVTAAMTQARDIAMVPPDSEAVDVARRLTSGAEYLLPVVDAEGDVMGFISRERVISWMVQEDHDDPPAPVQA